MAQWGKKGSLKTQRLFKEPKALIDHTNRTGVQGSLGVKKAKNKGAY